MRYLYSAAIYIAWALLHVIALWNGKMRLFVNGRKGLIEKAGSACRDAGDVIWFHAASYGEFEEARPVIEETRRRYPSSRILLTFFSPSGYEHMKNYSKVDWVFYLPMDTPRAMRRFVDAVHPSKVIFTIGEYWFNLLHELKKRNIDTCIMSVYMPQDSPYLKWYGAPFRRIYRTVYRTVITQSASTAELLRGMGLRDVRHIGDARFDRVLSIAAEDWHDTLVEAWAGGRKVFVAGSTCPGADDNMIIALANSHPDDKFLIVPHDPDPSQVAAIVAGIRGKSAVYTEWEGRPEAPDCNVLIVNKVGSLSRLYRYGFAAYVGAGFDTDCPHSVIEPAAYGMPVTFGPRYGRNLHCVEMVEIGCGFGFSDPESLCAWYDKIISEPEYLRSTSMTAGKYCQSGKGATSLIMDSIFK